MVQIGGVATTAINSRAAVEATTMQRAEVWGEMMGRCHIAEQKVVCVRFSER